MHEIQHLFLTPATTIMNSFSVIDIFNKTELNFKKWIESLNCIKIYLI